MKITPNANDPAQLQEFTQKLNEMEETLRHEDTLMDANKLRSKLDRAHAPPHRFSPEES